MSDVDSVTAGRAPAPDAGSAPAPQAGEAPARSAPWGRLLARGAAVESGAFALTQVVRLGSNLVLTRLLFPEAFGMMTALSLVIYGLFMLTDVGLPQAVMRSERGDEPAFLNTAWSIQALRGLGLWLGSSLLAWPISIIFREPLLLAMIPVGSAAAFLHGLASTRIFLLRRRIQPVPLAVLEIGSQLGGAVVMIALSWAGVGAWSLVWGNLALAALYAGFSHLLPGTHRDRFGIDAASRREIVHFGRWIFASSSMTFVAGRGDQFLLGRLLGTASLGLYNIGLTLAEAPELLANRVIGGLLFPLFARVHNEGAAELVRVYYRTRLVLDSLVHTGLGAMVALSPWLIHILYDQRYAAAVPMLQILALRTSVSLVASSSETLLVAIGLSRYGFRRNLAVAVSTFAAMPIGHHLGGSAGLLWGSTLARFLALGALWPALHERGLLRLRRELLVPVFLACGYGLGYLLALILPGR